MENRAEEILSASFHKSTVRFMVYPIIVYLSCRDLRDKCNNRRFHGRGRHLVGRAKNSDGLGRVIVSV